MEGKYNGSTLSMSGRNKVFNAMREMVTNNGCMGAPRREPLPFLCSLPVYISVSFVFLLSVVPKLTSLLAELLFLLLLFFVSS